MQRRQRFICAIAITTGLIFIAGYAWNIYDRLRSFQAISQVAEFVPTNAKRTTRAGIQVYYEDIGRAIWLSPWTGIRIQVSTGELPEPTVVGLFEPGELEEITLVSGAAFSPPKPILLEQSYIDEVAVCRSVKALHLGGLTIDALDLSHAFEELEELTIDNCAITRKFCIGHHPQVNSLKYIEAGTIRPVDLDLLISGATELRVCEIHCDDLSSRTLDAIAQCGTIEYLNLGGSSLSGAWLESATFTNRLQSLSVERLTPSQGLGQVFLRMDKLRILDLNHDAFESGGFTELLTSARNIEMVVLRRNELAGPPKKLEDAAFAALKQCSKLHTLAIPDEMLNGAMRELLEDSLPKLWIR